MSVVEDGHSEASVRQQQIRDILPTLPKNRYPRHNPWKPSIDTGYMGQTFHSPLSDSSNACTTHPRQKIRLNLPISLVALDRLSQQVIPYTSTAIISAHSGAGSCPGCKCNSKSFSC